MSAPSSELAPPAPFPPQRVCPHPLNQGAGGQHSLRVRGGANPDDWREILALCLLCGRNSPFFLITVAWGRVPQGYRAEIRTRDFSCGRQFSYVHLCAGIFKQSMNRAGIGFSYRSARLHSLAALVPWNRFLDSLKV